MRNNMFFYYAVLSYQETKCWTAIYNHYTARTAWQNLHVAILDQDQDANSFLQAYRKGVWNVNEQSLLSSSRMPLASRNFATYALTLGLDSTSIHEMMLMTRKRTTHEYFKSCRGLNTLCRGSHGEDILNDGLHTSKRLQITAFVYSKKSLPMYTRNLKRE